MNPAESRKDAQKPKGSRAEDLFIIDQDAQLSVSAIRDAHVDAQVALEGSRRPGGLNRGHSVAAATNSDVHEWPP